MISPKRSTAHSIFRITIIGVLAVGMLLPSAASAASATGEEFAVTVDASVPPNSTDNYQSGANSFIQGNVTFDDKGNYKITGKNKTMCFSSIPTVYGVLHWKVNPGGAAHTDQLKCNSLASWKTVTKDLNLSGSLNGGNSVELWACLTGKEGANCGNFHNTVIPGQPVSGTKDKVVKLTGEYAGITETATVKYQAAVAFLPGSYNLVGQLDLTGVLDDPDMPDAGSATGSGATCTETGVTGAALHWQTLPGGAEQTQSVKCNAVDGDLAPSAEADDRSRFPVAHKGKLNQGQSVEVWACLNNTSGAPLFTSHSKATP